MSASEQQEEVELLLQEAAYRLSGALKQAPRDGEDARMACENAHDAPGAIRRSSHRRAAAEEEAGRGPIRNRTGTRQGKTTHQAANLRTREAA